MKKLLLSASALIIAAASIAQECDQLFLSEYIVGTGNNKAYEVYNPTAEDIDLSGYELQRWSNGDTNPNSGGITQLAGTIPAYGTWVVVNGQTEDIPLDGGFISPKCDPELQALADQLDNPYPAPTYMNGNDALVLVNTNATPAEICDIFGKPGEDPGDAWTAPDGTYITDSQTMVRKPNVLHGVTSPPIVFDPFAQYDTLGIDVWTNLGIHECNCNPTSGISNQTPLNVSVYPTLVGDNTPITIDTDHAIIKIEIFDMTGKKVVSNLRASSAYKGDVNVNGLQAGVYIMNIYMDGNVTYSTRFVKE